MFNSKIRNSKLEIRNSVLNLENSRQKGFTLIEAVVASSVFAFLVASVLGVYMSTMQLDRKSKAQRAVVQNARFIMEYLSKEISNGMIDYGSYPNPSNVSSYVLELNLVNQADESEKITFQQASNSLSLQKSVSGVLVSTNLNSSQVKINKAFFLVRPSANPFTVDKSINQQPSVTVILEVQSNFGNASIDNFKLNLQSTFTPRYYPSRL
jgi:prepilin-type N-terminal cleavage/methylation domain-containing protein